MKTNKSKTRNASKKQRRTTNAKHKPGSANALRTVEAPKGKFHGAKGTGLSNCAELYMKALINPWGEFQELPCVPCTPADMTYRYRSINRGTFATSNTTGVGFVSWAPLNPTNDITSIRYSTTTYAGTTFANSGAAGTLSTAKAYPYNQAGFGANPGLSARLVGSSMRITNTTAPLYRQGSVLAARLATGDRLADLSVSNLQGNLENVKTSADKEGWFYWNFIPQEEADYDFPEGAYSYTDTSGNRAAQNYGFLVQGASLSNVSTFDWELVEFWEFAGGSSVYNLPNLEKSHADPVGLGRVMESVAGPRQSLNLRDQAKTYAENAVEMMAHSDSAAKTVEDLLGLSGLSIGSISTLAGSLMKMLLS